MGFEEIARERGREFAVGYQDLQFELEGVGNFGIVGGLDFGDEAVQACAQGGVGDLVFVAEGFERARIENETFEELQVFLVQGFPPGGFHKINMRLNFIEVNKV